MGENEETIGNDEVNETQAAPCFMAHENMEEVRIDGTSLVAPLPEACCACGYAPVTYAANVAVYSAAGEFLGMKSTVRAEPQPES